MIALADPNNKYVEWEYDGTAKDLFAEDRNLYITSNGSWNNFDVEGSENLNQSKQIMIKSYIEKSNQQNRLIPSIGVYSKEGVIGFHVTYNNTTYDVTDDGGYGLLVYDEEFANPILYTKCRSNK
jgi:hypothetical protein